MNHLLETSDKVKETNKLSLFNVDEGFVKGNMFKNEYKEYKNYTPKIVQPKSEKDLMLLTIQKYQLAAHDMTLYLDVYPNSKEAFDYFMEFREKCSDAKKQYEQKYGPLNLQSEFIKGEPFEWENTKWPWEGSN